MKRILPPKLDLVLVGLITLLATALRLERLGSSNVWWDEGYSVYLARKDLVTIALETVGDVHPPVHYWFLHAWMRLVGETEFAVRYSSVLYAALSIVLVYWLGRRTVGRGVGVVAALLLATSRLYVEWSQQMRMYPLVVCLSILSIALTVALWERPRRRLWIGHVAVTTVGLYTLYLSGLVPLVESLAVLVCCLLPLGGRRLRFGFVARWVGTQIVSLALFVPWVVLFVRTPRATPAVLFPIDLGTFLQACFTAFPIGISAYLDRYTGIMIATLAILAVGALLVGRHPHQRLGVLLYLLVLLPPFVVFALSFPNPVLYAPNLSVRYILIFLPAYNLLLAAALVYFFQPRFSPLPTWGRGVGGVRSLLRSIVGVAATAFLAGAVIWALADYYPGRRLIDDYTVVTTFLKANARPGDVVVLNSDREWPMYLYYVPDGTPDGRRTGSSGGMSTPLARVSLSVSHQIAPDEADRVLGSALAKHGSLWLLTSDNGADSDPAGVATDWLEKHARAVGSVEGLHRKISLYTTDQARSLAEPAVFAPERSVQVGVEDGPTIVGYDLATPQAIPGESLRFAVYWKSSGPLPADAHAALRLFDARGALHRESRVPLSPANPPDRWRPGGIVRVDYVLALPEALKPGRYTLALGFSAGGRDRPVGGGAQAMLARVAVLTPHDAPPPATRPAPRTPTDYRFGDRIHLAGFDLDAGKPLAGNVPARADLAPGTVLRLRLYWESLQAVDRPYTTFAQIVGPIDNPATGNPVWAQRDAQAGGALHPTDRWAPGEFVADDFELALPPDAPAGTYRLIVGLYDVTTGQRFPVNRNGQPSGDAITLFEGERK